VVSLIFYGLSVFSSQPTLNSFNTKFFHVVLRRRVFFRTVDPPRTQPPPLRERALDASFVLAFSASSGFF